ncbi:phosphonopyruvate decarboxylase [Eubacteriales bacterium OttesenSCG-928-N13]|nr:phosphonopyruvate decarboxylase [Eubacteriales bacterium OttesenSCG-928-N13]
MFAQTFLEILNADFYAGVPDSQLKALCDCLMQTYGVNNRHHIIAANEGNAVGLAAGYHLATGKIPVVYMQNSGIGNIINPAASLINEHVYAIPSIFVVGWRGEPGIHDEPQHVYQGMVTLQLLLDMQIDTFILDQDTTEDMLWQQMHAWQDDLAAGKSVAIVVRKNGLRHQEKANYHNDNRMMREDIIRCITDVSGEDMIVSTTGKASRELFEIREAKGQSHGYDFLTVGSMGHSSSIALGIALNAPNKTIWCLDGDGAVLMHMGAMALIGANAPANLIHVVINNAAHETVGGMPTVANEVDLVSMAKACGYARACSVSDEQALKDALESAKASGQLSFVEVKAAIGSRADLGRPTTTPIENKTAFMENISIP